MMNVKNLILILSLLFGFHDILHAMKTETKENPKSLQKSEEKKFVEFSEHLRNYNIDERTIEEFASQPYNKFQDSTPYVYCQPPFTTKFFNFIQKAFLGSSAKKLKNALYALRLIKVFSEQPLHNFTQNTFVANKIPDKMRSQELHIHENSNIIIQEKNLYTEQDNLKRDLPDKVSFTIDGNMINYTIEMDSTTNQCYPENIPNRLFKACAAIENGILIKRPLRNFFLNILGYTGLLLPYCKEILPYCKDNNDSSLAAVGFLTTILVANYFKGYFEQKEEEACKLHAEKASGQKSIDYKYKELRCLEDFKGKKNRETYILNISAIEPLILSEL